MRGLLAEFPGAQRALFRKFHIGGCSHCGFSPEETLAAVCARNENLDVDLVIGHIVASEEAERLMQIEPRELAERLKKETVQLVDVRTREEFEAVKIDHAQLFNAELISQLSPAIPTVIYDHAGGRSLDAAAYFQGHGFTDVKALRGGIDAWSVEVDPKLPRYHLENA